jgi:hypothetical protein
LPASVFGYPGAAADWLHGYVTVGVAGPGHEARDAMASSPLPPLPVRPVDGGDERIAGERR